MRTKPLCSLFIVALSLGSTAAYAQLYDVAWTFGDVGLSAYRLDAFEPAGAQLGTLGSQNPTLPLERGKRYQVRVVNYTVHPFDVISKGASAVQDKVLLSMGSSPGTFESDPEVNWQDAGQGIVRFTLTEGLYQAMLEAGRVPGYRCRLHPSTMRGNFTIPSNPPFAERISRSSIQVDLTTVASGLAAPVDLQPDPVQPERLYVVDQAGLVYVIEQGKLRQEPLLDVKDRLVPLGILGTFDENDYDERGLLGFALHPGLANPASPGFRRVYTYTSEPVSGPADFTIDMPPEEVSHQNVVTEWQVAADGSRVEPNSARVLLRIDHPQFNHDGGMLAFGPDGYLYLSIGDGGGANDTGPGHGLQGNGQNLHTIQGSILRIDPLAPERTPNSRDLASANGAYRVPWDNPLVGVEGIDEIYAIFLQPVPVQRQAQHGRRTPATPRKDRPRKAVTATGQGRLPFDRAGGPALRVSNCSTGQKCAMTAAVWGAHVLEQPRVTGATCPDSSAQPPAAFSWRIYGRAASRSCPSVTGRTA
jgi:hypothetical protein